MGSPPDEEQRREDERQACQEEIEKGFFLGVHPLTNLQYQKLKPNVRPLEDEDGEKPMTSLSWLAACEFCDELTEEEKSKGLIPKDWRFSLPTERQWEYACRAKSTTPYSFGERLSPDEAVFHSGGKGHDAPAKIGLRKSNAFGFQDMHGNVREWCLDLYE